MAGIEPTTSRLLSGCSPANYIGSNYIGSNYIAQTSVELSRTNIGIIDKQNGMTPTPDLGAPSTPSQD